MLLHKYDARLVYVWQAYCHDLLANLHLGSTQKKNFFRSFSKVHGGWKYTSMQGKTVISMKKYFLTQYYFSNLYLQKNPM